MTGPARRTAALAATAAAIAGCGGTGHHPAQGGMAHNAAPTPYTIAPAPYSIDLPVSARGPTTCTIYVPGFATQIVVDSHSLDVRAQCAVWAANHPGYGYLWGYEQPVDTPDGIELCAMKDPGRDLTASVVEDTGFAPVTASERTTGLSACATIVAAGWRRLPTIRGSGGLKIVDLPPRSWKTS